MVWVGRDLKDHLVPTSLPCEVFVVFLSADAFAVGSKRFILGLRVLQTFALFPLFNKTSIMQAELLSFPA